MSILAHDMVGEGKLTKLNLINCFCKMSVRGVFQLEMVKIILTSHFHKKLRATIGFVPTSQLP